MRNRTAYMEEPGTMHIREIEVPQPAEDEVQVKIEYCGICGSDVHYYEYGRVGDYIVDGQFILGHEVAGTITKTGDHVTSLKIGDRVALEPGIPCGKCEFCKSGKYNLCPDVRFFATPPIQGALQDYVVHPADMCFCLPDNVTTEEGALVEPLCVGLHACRQGKVEPGKTVVILGAGCIGLVTLLSAKAFGASKVIVVDLFEKRLEFAKKLGADYTVNAKEQDTVKAVKSLLGKEGADIVFETAGAPKTIYQTSLLARAGGTVVLVGIAVESDLNYNFAQVMGKELTIKSVFRYCNLYPLALSAIANGTIDVKQIVTHRFMFDDVKEAFDCVIEDAENVVKGIIEL
ncbi:L-iditol 2-dehydrogenase [Muricomes intestini]|uniref:L-iditol 2-dehydrogenase n=1 Tax=Muricomes intestini TaxID=1796634 RepID=A0A4R3K5H8_9FIRM|nr:NAD(P)-dependent alcohol dehydrogenase [Muricomes intestini]TCS78084.1 L-iditol 2-dehydrogenase [Muricomes intestini]